MLDCRADKLTRWGDVHPALSSRLDAQVRKSAGITRYPAAIIEANIKEKP